MVILAATMTMKFTVYIQSLNPKNGFNGQNGHHFCQTPPLRNILRL